MRCPKNTHHALQYDNVLTACSYMIRSTQWRFVGYSIARSFSPVGAHAHANNNATKNESETHTL